MGIAELISLPDCLLKVILPGGGWYTCGTNGGGGMSGDAGALPECDVIHR